MTMKSKLEIMQQIEARNEARIREYLVEAAKRG